MKDEFRFYRPWFYAAAAYNAFWGIIVIFSPNAVCDFLHIKAEPMPIFQALGMVVGVFAYGYYLLAKDPLRYCGLIWTGLAGKMCGPIGFVFFASRGQLPWSFSWTVLTNDVLWWPAFWMFALKYARSPLL